MKMTFAQWTHDGETKFYVDSGNGPREVSEQEYDIAYQFAGHFGHQIASNENEDGFMNTFRIVK